MKIGVCVHQTENTEEAFINMKSWGFDSCQLLSWDPTLWTDANAQKILAATKKHGIDISAFWCGWTGPSVWNFYEGHQTLGLVPMAFRHNRLKELIAGAEFAAKIGIRDIVTHVGFIPENPTDENYLSLVYALRYYAEILKNNGQRFLFETGQETPVTLLRTIELIGLDNVGINLDTGNLIMYGKANPLDAVRVFKKYVWQLHCKDALYPTNGRELGCEVKIGTGLVDFPAIINMLRENGYAGTLTIEREISGDEQTRDIIDAKKYLEKI